MTAFDESGRNHWAIGGVGMEEDGGGWSTKTDSPDDILFRLGDAGLRITQNLD